MNTRVTAVAVLITGVAFSIAAMIGAAISDSPGTDEPRIEVHAPSVPSAPSDPVPAPPGQMTLTVSPEVPEYKLVFIHTNSTAKFFDLQIMTVRNSTVQFVTAVSTAQTGQWVFTGPPGDYSIRLSAYDPQLGIMAAVGQVKILGAQPPPVVVTPPTTPTTPPEEPKKKITKVTYVYEKDSTSVPRQVLSALSKINNESAGSIVANEFEEDTHDGTGDTPQQYKIALEAARKAGLPALVVQAGTNVVKVLKSPTTEAEVVEAAK